MAAPFSTFLSLLVMHGISMTLWRHLMNSTIPFSVRSNNNLPRFTFQLSNTLTPPTGVDNLLNPTATTLSPSMLASSSQLISSSSSSSSGSSSAYIQPIIQLHPIPISLPSLTGLQGLQGLNAFHGLQGLTGLTPSLSTGSAGQMILLPISPRPPDNSYIKQQQPFYIQQIPAPVVQVTPTLVTQASTLKPIRVFPPKNFVPSISSSTSKSNIKGSTIFSYNRETKLPMRNNMVIKKIGETGVTTVMPIRLISNRSDDALFDVNTIVTDDMLDSKGDTKHKGFRSVCFYLFDQVNETALPANKIDPTLCNYIIAGHAYVGPESLLWFQNPENNTGRLHELNDLKIKNPELKVLLSIRMGQSKDASKSESNVLASEEKRNQFVRSLIDILSVYNLDGVDFFRLHQNETKYQESKSDLITLLKLTRKECLRRGKLDTLITATVSGHPDIASKFYNITELIRSIDYLNLLTFDYHYYTEKTPFTGHHSLLYPRVPTHSGIEITSTDEVCKFWIKQKIAVRKLILGVPLFARTFNLAFPFGQGFNSPSVGPGLGRGKLNYTKVCELLNDGGISEFDEKGQVPFAHRNYDWISYENERSLSIKSRYAASRMFGGVMIYALNYDDWAGTCRDDSKSFPLLRAVSGTLKLASVSTFKN